MNLRNKAQYDNICNVLCNSFKNYFHASIMRISTNQVSSVMFRPEKLKIRKKSVNCERVDKNQTECHEIEPNPSKDRVMHEGDNASF
jgi:hypothetical protein